MFNIFKKKFPDESLEEQRVDLERFASNGIEEFLGGLSCDELPDASGDFGRSITNPIPVNGPTGEIKYLNRLRNENGVGFIFHRLGPIESTIPERLFDVFEVVSFDGMNWDILYLDMYHPRRTTKAPKEYHLSEYNPSVHSLPVGFGTHYRDPRFPFGISKFIERDYHALNSVISIDRLVMRFNEFIKDGEKFIRPSDHKEKVASVLWELNPVAYSQPIVDILNFELDDLDVDEKKDGISRIKRFIDSLDVLIEFVINDDEYLREYKKDVVNFLSYIKEKTIQAQTLPNGDYMGRLKILVSNLGRIGGEKAGGYIEMVENEKPNLVLKEENGMASLDTAEKFSRVAIAVLTLMEYF